ncbi:MAG: glycosyltransferase family 2 protein [Pedobacter sp.]|nr:MAG: glycosyltransferase family 2 protein [Pedobacter sp.]
MTSKPLISVIVPCYNVAAYVERAVQSILTQTYLNLEVLIVDDASTDNSLELCQSFCDTRLKIITCPENTQKIGAVNKALALASGDYIAFQDADDWSEPERIEKQLEAFLKDPHLGICFTDYRYAGSKNDSAGAIAHTDCELKDEFLHFGYKGNTQLNASACPSIMISRAALEKTGGYHEYFKGRVAEDVQWIYRILKYFKGITVPEMLYHYTVREDSLTGIQFSGKNAKAAYSWPLLKRIIYFDVNKNLDLLAKENEEILTAVELEACEEALVESLQYAIRLREVYENSRSFRIGKQVVAILKKFKRK